MVTDDLKLGKRWAEVRRATKLSRETFAQRAGLTPAAVWRIEARGRFKDGELDKLREAFPDHAVEPVETPAQHALPATTTVAVATPTGPLEEDSELVQWVDFSELPTPPQVVSLDLGSPGTVTHLSPTSGEWMTPCCGRSPFELPRYDRITVNTEMVTCRRPTNEGVTVTSSQIGAAYVVAVPSLSPRQMSLIDGITRITNSEIQTFKRCRRKWWLHYYRGLRPRVESPFGARAIGDRIHRALRLHYHPDLDRRIDVREAIETIITFDRKTLDELYPETEVFGPALETFTKESDLERIMVAGYVEWLAETGADEDIRVVGAEEYAEADLPEMDNVRVVGKLDLRVRRVSDNLRLFLDHKTLGDFAAATAALPADEQMLFYMLIESLRKDESERCVGAVYNMLRRVKRTAKATPPFYARVDVHHSQRTLDSFLVRTQGTIYEILELRAWLDNDEDHRRVAYPTPTRDCRWQCPVADMCTMFDDGSRVEDALAAYFEEGDPTAHYVRET